MYEPLTRYIEVLASDEIGILVGGECREGIADDPIPMLHMDYSEAVREFEQEFYAYAEAHPEYGFKEYRHVLESKGVEFDAEGFSKVDLVMSDAQTVLLMTMSIIRAERFSEGVLLEYLESGAIPAWLTRLRQLDEESG